MIDKIELIYMPPDGAGLNLSDIQPNAQSNGLTIVPATDIRQRGYFYRIQQRPSIYFKANRAGYIERIYSNPSHFRNWNEYVRIMRMLERPRTARERNNLHFRWLDNCTVARIDYAVRFTRDFNELLHGLDVWYRQQRRQMVRTGGSNTGVNFGAHPDVVNVYDESQFYRRRSARRIAHPDIAADVERGLSFTKMERQLRTPQKVAQMARNHLSPQRTLLFGSLRQHLRDVASGIVSPFERIDLHCTTVRPASELRNRGEQDRAAQLRGALRMASYGDVRRAFNTDRNFNRLYLPLLTQTPLPSHEQPVNLLQLSLRFFLETEDLLMSADFPPARPRRRGGPNANVPAHPRRRGAVNCNTSPRPRRRGTPPDTAS